MMSVSKKLGLMTVSSTETEVVSTGERFLRCAWFRYFRTVQGEKPREDMFMQDNKSSVLMHKNYPYSIGKSYKHANARCFFAVDKIKKKEVKLVYCPTEEMLGNYSSKPLQGGLFIKQRNLIQGIKDQDYRIYKMWHRRAI